jgi:hypothetical protein
VAWLSWDDTHESNLYAEVPVAVFPVDTYEFPKWYRMTPLAIIILLLQMKRESRFNNKKVSSDSVLIKRIYVLPKDKAGTYSFFPLLNEYLLSVYSTYNILGYSEV